MTSPALPRFPYQHVALGGQRYRVERPWGDIPPGPGIISDVAVDAAGRVLVQRRTDPYAMEAGAGIIVLSPEGRCLAAWAGEVQDGHMFNIHPDGRVFVVDRDAHEVLIFSPEGRLLGGLGTRHGPGQPFNAPCDIAFAPDGTMYVADGYANARIHRFAADGTPMGGWGRPGRGPGEFVTPHSVAVLADGRVVVADRENDRLQIFTAAGEYAGQIGDLYRPMSVQAGPAGRLLVTDHVPRLSMFALDGTLLGRCRPVLNGAHGMWWDPGTGIIWQAEQTPNRLTRLVPV